MADNSAALRRARREDARIKRQRAYEAITALEASGQPVTFPAVAARASVSVSLLYSDQDLAGRIAAARDRQRQAGADRAWQLPARSLITEHSLRVELTNAKDQARRLTEEINLLRDRLSRQLGAQADTARGQALAPALDQLEARNAELEADNHHQRQLIARLQADHHELAETLDAARAMNRELMAELNRHPHSQRAGPPATASDHRQAVSTTSSTLDTTNHQHLPG
jgi:chromosome segregation ATPase